MPVKTEPITISLTQFTNFATKPPEQQLTEVRTIRKQHDEGYQVPPDCYKQFRDAVRKLHRQRKPKDWLDTIVARQTEPTRVKHYPELAAGYKKFLGRKNIEWFEPPRGGWKCAGLQINVSPELGLVINGEPTVVKLYLNEPKTVNKRRAKIIAHLMQLAIPSLAEEEVTTCVLDVRRGKPFPAGSTGKDQTALLRAQARSFVSLYREL